MSAKTNLANNIVDTQASHEARFIFALINSLGICDVNRVEMVLDCFHPGVSLASPLGSLTGVIWNSAS